MSHTPTLTDVTITFSDVARRFDAYITPFLNNLLLPPMCCADMYSGVWGICAASALAKNPRRPIKPESVLGRMLAKQLADIPANQCTDDDDLT